MRLVDTETGEVFSGFAIPQKKRYPYDIQQEGFMTMFSRGWAYLKSLDLTGKDFKVFACLAEYIDYGNWVSLSQETIAQELNLKQQNVARSIKKLVSYQVIERQRDPSDKRRWRYRLNPTIGWMGDANQWKKLMKERANEKIVPLVPPTK